MTCSGPLTKVSGPYFCFTGTLGICGCNSHRTPSSKFKCTLGGCASLGGRACSTTDFLSRKPPPLTPSGISSPALLGGSCLFVWDVFHQIAGLTFKHSADFFKCIDGQVLHRPRTNCRDGRRTYPGQISQLLLIDLFQGKLYPHAEFDHRITPFQAGLYHELSYFTTVCVKKF